MKLNIAVIGSPSSGKTTLVNELGKLLKINYPDQKIIIIEDFAREFIKVIDNKNPTFHQQTSLHSIAQNFETLYDKTSCILISDLSTIITGFYTLKHDLDNSYEYHAYVNAKGTAYQLALRGLYYYDIIIFCGLLQEQIEEAGRQFNKKEMKKIHYEMELFLKSITGEQFAYKIIFLKKSKLENRIEEVQKALEKICHITLGENNLEQTSNPQ